MDSTVTVNPIPTFAQSSADPSSVSLSIISFGKVVASVITLLGILNIVDPVIAGQAWGNFVEAIITAIPAGFAVYHTGVMVWGLIRKAAIAIFAKAPVQPTPVVTVVSTQ